MTYIRVHIRTYRKRVISHTLVLEHVAMPPVFIVISFIVFYIYFPSVVTVVDDNDDNNFFFMINPKFSLVIYENNKNYTNFCHSSMS